MSKLTYLTIALFALTQAIYGAIPLPRPPMDDLYEIGMAAPERTISMESGCAGCLNIHEMKTYDFLIGKPITINNVRINYSNYDKTIDPSGLKLMNGEYAFGQLKEYRGNFKVINHDCKVNKKGFQCPPHYTGCNNIKKNTLVCDEITIKPVGRKPRELEYSENVDLDLIFDFIDTRTKEEMKGKITNVITLNNDPASEN